MRAMAGRSTHLSLCLVSFVAACGVKLPDHALKADGAQVEISSSILEHHNGPSRSGVYVHPSFNRSDAAGMHLVSSTPVEGVVNAQPLFIDGQGAVPDVVLVVTEKNQVFAIDATTGVLIWKRLLDPPLPRQAIIDVLGQCGSRDPIGISGTPVADETTRGIYFDLTTPDNNRHARHLVYALSLDDGTTLPGWPVDIGKSVPGFRDIVQNQRGALTLLNGRVYVPYGGYTDCGDYRGWVVGIDIGDPALVGAWRPDVPGAGIWAPSGIASDGTSLFVATGNGLGEQREWNGAEAIIRLGDGPTFSGLPTDYFAPLDWSTLDLFDLDLGGSGVILLDLPKAKPTELIAALGKDRKLYLADRSNLGGIDGAILADYVSTFVIVTAPSAYTTAKGTYVTFTTYGQGIDCPGFENIVTIQVNPDSPLFTSTAWCAYAPGVGSTMVTTTDGISESIVWVIGAKFDSALYGFDGDTGALIAVADGAGEVVRYAVPIAAKGRIYVAGTDWLYAFAMK